jgi:hypothetical protein
MTGEVARKEKTTVARRPDSVPAWWPIIEDRLDRLSQDFRDERDRAEGHRQHMVDGLSLVERTVAALNNSVAALTARLEKVEPITQDYREHKAEGRGAAAVRRRAWAIGLSAFASLATLIGAVIAAVHMH